MGKGWESVTVVLVAASIPPSIWIHRTGVMCMFRVLGLHATLEIDKERDWTANAPALCEHGMKKEQQKTATIVFQSVPAFIHTHTSSSCTLILFFSVSAQNASPHSDMLFLHKFQILPWYLVYSFSLAKLLFWDLFYAFRFFFNFFLV